MSSGHEGGYAFNPDQRADPNCGRPTCGKCGQTMTPENARLRPELFFHDACLPDELKMPSAEAIRRANENTGAGSSWTSEPAPAEDAVEQAARLGYETMLIGRCPPDEHGWERQSDACKDDWRAAARAMLAPTLGRLIAALDACRAAVKYDESIAGAGARGDVLFTDSKIAYAESDDLDALYADWMTKSRAALAAADPNRRT